MTDHMKSCCCWNICGFMMTILCVQPVKTYPGERLLRVTFCPKFVQTRSKMCCFHTYWNLFVSFTANIGKFGPFRSTPRKAPLSCYLYGKSVNRETQGSQPWMKGNHHGIQPGLCILISTPQWNCVTVMWQDQGCVAPGVDVLHLPHCKPTYVSGHGAVLVPVFVRCWNLTGSRDGDEYALQTKIFAKLLLLFPFF